MKSAAVKSASVNTPPVDKHLAVGPSAQAEGSDCSTRSSELSFTDHIRDAFEKAISTCLPSSQSQSIPENGICWRITPIESVLEPRLRRSLFMAGMRIL
ncbi:hypothetical protein TNCV_2244791 [Trichonephila clavipes]|nr:hypothetical protein TNCV_2244791 [Trichonephila clavipes]